MTPAGLLITLVLIFIFQGDKIINYPLHILLIAIPLILQTYFIFFIGFMGTRKLRMTYQKAASLMKRNKAKFQFGTGTLNT